MTRTTPAFLVFALSLASGCTSYVDQYFVGADDYVLATRSGPEGARESYELRVAGLGNASLRVVRESDQQRASLGLQLVEIDKGEAERRGVKPYSGLLVRGVSPKSGAAQAGVLAGDVLLSVEGKEMVYLPQWTELEATLRGDQAVAAKVLRGQAELDLSVPVQWVRQQVTESETVPLETPAENPRPYAGVSLRGIPSPWCAKIFGEPRNAVVVTNVEVGSPAWIAGVRAGDVIDLVDGAPVPGVQDLMRQIGERGAQEQSMRWRVRRGPGQSHDATLELHDYSGETNAWVPLVFRLQDGAYMDRWSIGPFGLVMSNRNHYVSDSSTRTLQTRNVFSAILGLIHVESDPRETEVRLLWFIRFDT